MAVFSSNRGQKQKAQILRKFQRQPDPKQDGTMTWSLTTLQRALRQAEDGLSEVSTYTILKVLHEAGYTWQRDRRWSQTGQVVRKRKQGERVVTDPDTVAKKTGLNGLTRWVKRWG